MLLTCVSPLVCAPQLDEMLKKAGKKLDRVLSFELDDGLIVDRIAGRRIHKASGRSYHLQFNPPKVPGKDDVRVLM
jgi:adenylate kinase